MPERLQRQNSGAANLPLRALRGHAGGVRCIDVLDRAGQPRHPPPRRAGVLLTLAGWPSVAFEPTCLEHHVVGGRAHLPGA